MSKLTCIVLFFVIITAGCKTTNSDTSAADGVHFGETIDTVGMITYADLLGQMESADSVVTKVYGEVSGVCQTKGCWMNIVSPDDSTKTEMFVQFKDYGFFMPKDLAGKQVVMKGKAYREVTSVDDLRHFAEDEGLTPEEIAKITEPKTELKFMASGVVIK
ncbi:MAG: DUF4920 domain-containing protein [Saprospiraceae bacterium]